MTSNPFMFIFFLSNGLLTSYVSLHSNFLNAFDICCTKTNSYLAGFFIKKEVGSYVIISDINHLSVNPTKWSNTLKQSVCCSKVNMDLRAYIFSY